jgi:hypothetical protein
MIGRELVLRALERLSELLAERGVVVEMALNWGTAMMIAFRARQATRDVALPTPWFATPGRAMRATLILESPASFRERNLLVTANALSVA